MRNHSLSFALVLACLLSLGLTAVARAQDMAKNYTGTWVYTFEGRNGESRTGTIHLKQDGEKLTGDVSGWNNEVTDISNGQIADGKATWVVVREWNGNQFKTDYEATLEGDTLKVKTTSPGRDGQIRTREYEAKRQGATTQPAA